MYVFPGCYKSCTYSTLANYLYIFFYWNQITLVKDLLWCCWYSWVSGFFKEIWIEPLVEGVSPGFIKRITSIQKNSAAGLEAINAVPWPNYNQNQKFCAHFFLTNIVSFQKFLFPLLLPIILLLCHIQLIHNWCHRWSSINIIEWKKCLLNKRGYRRQAVIYRYGLWFAVISSKHNGIFSSSSFANSEDRNSKTYTLFSLFFKCWKQWLVKL